MKRLLQWKQIPQKTLNISMLLLTMLLLLSNSIIAQDVWPLTSTQNVTSASGIANATASNQTLTGLSFPSSGQYNGATSGTGTANTGERVAPVAAGTWPGESNTTGVDGRFMEFLISPATSYFLNVTQIKCDLGISAGTSLRASFYYYIGTSAPANLAACTAVSGSSTAITPTTTMTTSTFGSLNINVPSGKNLYIRMYPSNNSASSQTRFIAVANFTVTGTSALPSTDATLSALATTAGALTPSFSSSTTSYSTPGVTNATTSVTVTPTVNQANATLTVNGSAATSGSPATVSLSVGSNTIPVVVTAQDGSTTKTYNISVTRAAAASPTITPGAVSGANTYVQGFAASQSSTTISVGASALTSSISVGTSSSNFVVASSAGGPFASTATLPSSGGTVYVQLAAGLTNASNASFSGNIQLTDATDGISTPVTVAVTGTVTVATSYTSTAGGDWNSGSTWSGGFIPTAGAAVSIVHAVTVNSDQSGVTVGAVSLSAGGTLTFNNSGSAGKLSAASVSISVTTVLDMTNGGILTLSGLLTNSGTFTSGTGTVVLTGSNTWSSALTFNNLTISSGTTTVAANFIINGDLSISGTGIYTFSNGSARTLSIAGNLSVSGSGGISNTTSGGSSCTITLSGSGKTMTNTGTGNLFTKMNIVVSGTYTLSGNFDYSSANSTSRSVAVSGSLNLSTYTLTMGISPITATGTLTIATGTLNTACVSGALPASGTWTGTINYSGASQNIVAGTYNNLTVSGTGTPVLPATLSIGGTFTPGGLTYTTTSSTVTFTGSSIPAFSFNNLTVTNVSGVSLAGAVSVSGTFTLSANTILTTTTSNLLTITNTASTAISGAGSTAFINGPLAWTLPNGASVNTYTFPVGNGTSYNPLSLVSPTASAVGTVAQVQYNTSNSGTFNASLSALDASVQWSIAAATGNISAATLNITSASTLGAYDAIAYATASGGSYASLAGTVSGQSINGSNAIATISAGSTNYFGLGTKAVITVNDPASFSSPSSTTSQINLSATANGSGNSIVVLYSTTNSFTTPSNGVAAGTAGNAFAGGTILYNGTASGLTNHTGLSSNSTYYYVAYSYDGSNNYSPGVTVTTATLAVPTNGSIASSSTGITITNAVVTAGGGATLSARGVAIGTTNVSGSATHYADASITTGTLASQTTSSPSLLPQTAYYAWAYASNAGGTNFAASPVSFYTLSSPATAAASNVTLVQSAQTSVAVSVSTPATYPASGATKAGYLVIYNTGASSPSTSWLANGVAPASQTPTGGIGFSKIGADSIAPTAPSATGIIITGLSAATQYSMIVVPYTWDGTNAATYNYATSIASTAATITLSNTNTDYAVFGASTTTGSVTNSSKLTASVASLNIDSVATSNNVLSYARYNAADALGYIWKNDGSSATTSAAFDGTTTESRYVDYIVTPAAGTNYTVNNISVPVTIAGTSTAMGYAIAYSVNGGTFTQLSSSTNTTPAANYTATANGTNSTTSIKVTLGKTNQSTITNISGAGISVAQNQTLKVRVIMWRQTTTTSGSTTINVGPLVIAGVTSVAPPAISSSLTASGIVGTAISTYTITASSSPTSYNATGLPAGLSINTTNGQITGTPTDASGSPYSVTISATNAAGTGSATLVFTIASAPVPVISGTPFATQYKKINTAISTITLSASNSPTSWQVASGSLPTGLNIDNSGDITGTPTATGSFTANITATNVGGASTSVALTIVVTDVPTISSISPSAATQNGSGFTITVNGANFVNGASTVTWGGSSLTTTYVSATQLTATVPSGNITSVGTTAVGVSTTAAGASASTKTFTIANASATWLSASNTSMATPIFGNSSGSSFDGTATIADVLGYVYSTYSSGGTLSAWWNTSASAQTLTGQWTTDGSNGTSHPTYSGTTTSAGAALVNAKHIEFAVKPTAGKQLSIPSISFSIANGGSSAALYYSAAYSTDGTTFIPFTGSAASSTTSSTNATLPTGTGYTNEVNIAASTTSVTTFTPASAIVVNNGSTLAVRIIMWRKNAASSTANNPLSISNVVVTANTSNAPTPVITSSLSDNGSVGTADSYTITASNGPIVSYSASGLPPGMSLNSVTGVISGTPTTIGTYNVTIGASNGTTTGTATYTYTVGASTNPVINSTLTASGTVGNPFSYRITASNNPTSFAATGLPAGLSINTSTGYITGTLTTSGSSTITISATNSTGTSTKSLVLTTTAASYYYYGGTGALDNYTNWFASNGSNAASAVPSASAAVFTQGGITFEIRTDATTAADAGTWTVSGTGSKVILGNAAIAGKILTIASGKAIAATIDITAALTGTNTLLLQDVNIPTFGTLNATSTINYGGSVAQTITTSANYGNLVISNTIGASPVLGSTNTMVNLTVSAGAVLSLGGSSATILTVTGAATINGTLDFLQSSSTSYIGGSGSFTVNAGATIYLASTSASGAIQLSTSSGNIRIATGTRNILPGVSFVFQGNGAQVTGAGFPSSCANLTINNTSGVTLSQALDVTGKLIVTTGTLATGGFLTLKSTSITNSAVVDQVGGAITGTAIVERYIPHGFRGYRDIAPEVYNASGSITKSIYYNWQENGTSPAGYGTFITGPTAYPGLSANAIDNTLGFDQSGASSYNTQDYTFVNGTWTALANTKSTTLDPFTGYRLLIRGDRTSNIYTSPVTNTQAGLTMYNATTLRATGNLVYGTVTYNTVANGGVTNTATGGNAAVGLNPTPGGFSMVANPYVCPVSWTTVYNSSVSAGANINGTWYFLDPTYSAAGSYDAYNALSGAANTYSGRASDLIQAGQAFFVQNAASSPVSKVVFTEAAKAASSAKAAVFGASQLSKIYVSLMKQSATTKTFDKVDGAAVAFRGDFGNKVYGPQDALKFTSATDNLAISDKGKSLSIDGRLPATASDAIPLAITKPTATAYQLSVDASNYSSNGFEPMLYDAFKNKTKALGAGTTTINFTVDANNAASFSNRFTILFTPSALPVNSIVASASLNNKVATISWKTAGEKNVVRYEVEKSADAKLFTTIGQSTAKNTATASYTTTDNSVTATTYYRIKAVSTTGAISYSNVAKLSTDNRLPSYSLYPNPLKGGNIVTVGLGNVVAGKYTVSIYNALGQKVSEQTISHAGGSATHAISINNALAAGTYSVTISEAGSKQLVHQSTLSVQP